MLWDDIDSLCLIPTCTYGYNCGASQKLSKFQQNQKVIQFLMGLNKTYNVMRGSILMKSHLPTIGQVYSLLLQEETQMELHSTSYFMADSASLYANSERYNNSANQFGSNTSFNKKPGVDARKVHYNYCKKRGQAIPLINVISYMDSLLISSLKDLRKLQLRLKFQIILLHPLVVLSILINLFILLEIQLQALPQNYALN